MGPAQGLHNVIEAASTLTSLPSVQFVLIGDGLDQASLEEAVKARQLSNVRFFPRQPMSQIPSFYALADVLLVHLTDEPLFEIIVPGKTQSYLASGRPLLVSVSGDTAELVLKAGAGLAVRPMIPADLARAVKKLYTMSPAERKAMGDAGRDYYLKNLTPNVFIDRYEQLFHEIIRSKGLNGNETKTKEENNGKDSCY
jgi:glycosyltransferase involved in cell wall biosynthesis